MKKNQKSKLTKKQMQCIILLSVIAGGMLNKRQRSTIIVMLGMPENSGTPKRLRCMYDKPSTISALIDYYKTFMLGMHADPLFTDFADLLDSADDEITKLEKAEIGALGKLPGKTQERNLQFSINEIKMEKVLEIVQDAGDADSTQAAGLFARHLLKIDSRSGRPPTGEEVTHGEKSGTILVKNKYVDANTSYLRMISSDKTNWYVGDFGKKVKGIISKINEVNLKPGTLYYVRSMRDGKEGKSDWGPIFEIYCL